MPGNRTKHRTKESSNRLQEFQRFFSDAVRRHQAGRLAEAVAQYGRAIALRPEYAEARNNLGAALAAQGRISDAIAQYQRALQLDPDSANTLSNFGQALATQGRIDEAMAHCLRALSLNPSHVGAHHNLGLALAARGRIEEAAAHFGRALILNPNLAQVHFDMGVVLARQGATDDAKTHYERAVFLSPDFAEALTNLGTLLYSQGKRDAAVAHLMRAATLRPDSIAIQNGLGIALAELGRIGEALARFRIAEALDPRDPATQSNLGLAFEKLDRIDEAVAQYEKTLAIDPDHAETHNNLGNLRSYQGRLDDAMTHFGRAIASRPDYAAAHLNRAQIKTFHREDADLESLELLAGKAGLCANAKMYSSFALGKAFDDVGDYPRAFEYLRQGNQLKRSQNNYDESAALGFLRRVSAVFKKDLFDRHEGEGDRSEALVFVLGMPRSGSTLIEQILASHPQIQGGGEREGLEQAIRNTDSGPVLYPERIRDMDGEALRATARTYLDSLPAPGGGRVRIVDKTLGNFVNIGLIRLVLPHARIVHTMRDPIDTCLSCYSKIFTTGVEFSYDLRELGRYYRGYRQLMSHWRSVLPPGAMLDLSYEDVVDDLEGQARRLIDYCGLPWDDSCLSFHKTSRLVRTASHAQVRRPLFRSSLGRWRRYEENLTPLLDELRAILPGECSSGTAAPLCRAQANCPAL